MTGQLMNKRGDEIEQFKQYLHRRAPGRRTAIDYVSDVRQFAADIGYNLRRFVPMPPSKSSTIALKTTQLDTRPIRNGIALTRDA